MRLQALGLRRRPESAAYSLDPERLNELAGQQLFRAEGPVAGLGEDLPTRFLVKADSSVTLAGFRAAVGARFGPVEVRRDRGRIAGSVTVRPLGGLLTDGRRWFTVSTKFPLAALLAELQYDPLELSELTGELAEIPGVLHVEVDLPSENLVWPLQTSIPGCSAGRDAAPDDVGWAPRLVGFFDLPSDRPTGVGVDVGHIDTGYTDHAELNLADAYDLSAATSTIGPGGGKDPMPEGSSHGTATGTIITSEQGSVAIDDRGNPSEGITGVAPGATVVAVRAMRDVVLIPFFTQADVAAAVHHCISEGCAVLSMSFGGVLSSAATDALQLAYDNDMILCAAAGNCVRFIVKPARLPTVIACAGVGTNPVDGSVHPWEGTSRGSAADIAAPAENVWVGEWTNGNQIVRPSEGTSFAAPHVAAGAALWLEHHGSDKLMARYGPEDVRIGDVFRHVVRSTAVTPPGWDTGEFGAGLLNLPALLAAPLPDAGAIFAGDDIRAG